MLHLNLVHVCLKALYFPVVLQPVIFFIYNFYLQFQELLTGVTASASSPLLKEVYDSFIHQETSMEGNGQITLGVETLHLDKNYLMVFIIVVRNCNHIF